MCRARRSEPAAYHTRRRRRAARPRIAPRRRPHDPPAPAHIGPIVIVIVRIGIAIDHRIPRSAVVIAATVDRILAGHLIEKGRSHGSRRDRPHDASPTAATTVKVTLADFFMVASQST